MHRCVCAGRCFFAFCVCADSLRLDYKISRAKISACDGGAFVWNFKERNIIMTYVCLTMSAFSQYTPYKRSVGTGEGLAKLGNKVYVIGSRGTKGKIL